MEVNWTSEGVGQIGLLVVMAASAARRVRRRKMMLNVRDMSSAMGKASHTRVRFPVWDSSQATGSSTTSWRQTETMRL